MDAITDTQWPRWEVFKQDNPKKPHQAVGSVHAVDPEHALLAARDVFVRRPKAVSLWVAPAQAIFSMTQEELNHNPDWQQEEIRPDTPQQTYAIFRKSSHRHAMTFADYVGDVEAASPKQALSQAITTFAGQPALAWWIVPAEAIFRSEPDVVESWFAPALSKTYKQQSAYGFVGPKGKRDDDE